MAPPVAQLRPVPFREAIAAFARRGASLRETNRWTDMMHDEHSAAFTVARSLGYDINGDIFDAITKVRAEGGTLADFDKQLVPVLKAKGWWGTVEEEDGEIVQLGSHRRLALIFNVNMRVSYAAGRWEQIQRTKADLPYLMYSAINDRRTRPQHRAWHGTILPVDHAWWDVHYPPCGWNCRCGVIQLTAAEARRRGITVLPPDGPPRRFFNRSTGQTIEVPHGIDPGWGYNVGKAAARLRASEQLAEQMAEKLLATPPAVAAVEIPAATIDAMADAFALWFDLFSPRNLKGEMRVVGALSKPALDFLRTQGNVDSGAIVVTDQGLSHIMRDFKREIRPAEEIMRRLPVHIARPAAVLWDRDKGNLVYVVAPEGDRGTRFIIDVGRTVRTREAGRRVSRRTNEIISGQEVGTEALRDTRRYVLISGEL